jgi:hypothetical protein
MGLHAVDPHDAAIDVGADVSADAGGTGSGDAGVGEVTTNIRIDRFDLFDAAFGEIGLKVGPRTGPEKRTQDDKEWYVARIFLREAIRAKRLHVPLSIEKAHPPKPDFVIRGDCCDAYLEITEASDESDQREMTKMESSDEEAILLGAYGGRFRDGASEPGHAWASDVANAIERKAKKAIFAKSKVVRHLVIYPNSNASFLLFDEDDERRAFSLFRRYPLAALQSLRQMANGCFVHILGKEVTFFDILGEAIAQSKPAPD